MRAVTYTCDIAGCGKQHTANNGFYLLKKRGKWIVLGAWSEDEDLDTFEHYCGVNHLFQRISELRGGAVQQ